MSKVLLDVLKEAETFKKQNKKFLAVFDLDSTLYDLTPRIQKIVMMIVNDPVIQNRYPEEAKKALALKILPKDWGLREPLARVGITPEQSPQFFKEMVDHWRFLFFSNRFLHEDHPIPGSVAYVKAILKAGAEIMYLTGRDVPRMLEGTIASLKQHDFPIETPGVELILKPDHCMEDASFKVDILRKACDTHDRVWLFENEPVNINLVQQELKNIGVVFIDTNHSGIEHPHPELDKIPHFEVDSSEFKEFGDN